MKDHLLARFAGSICRRWLSGSIAALFAGAAVSSPFSAHAADEEPAYFWLGGTGNLWTGTNWAYDQAGDPTEGTPGVGSDVTFSANGAQNQTTTLGADFYLNSLTINDPVPVTIGGNNTLTIFNDTVATGITVNSGAGLVTISSNLNLGQNGEFITVNNAAGLVISGSVSGSMGLVKQGTGTLTLTGANTFTGSVGIGGGVVQINSDGNLGDPSNAVYLFNGATLRVLSNVTTNRALFLTPLTVNIVAEIDPTETLPGTGGGSIDTNGYSLTWNGVISGSGSLTKVGAGVLTLTGADTYTGSTIISQGSLIVDGSTASASTTVNPGAFLGGSGLIGGSVVNNGVVAPGDAPGTLTISGNYSQSSSGALLIRIGGAGASQHDLLAVGGAASLGGALDLQQLNNFRFRLDQKITVLTAGAGVSGQFSTLVNGFPQETLVGENIIYLPNSVAVEGVQLPFSSLPNLTPNERAVANALDDVLTDPRFFKVFSYLDRQPINRVIADLDRLGAEELTSAFQMAISLAQMQNFNLQRRLEDVRNGSNGFSSSGFSMNGSPSGPGGPTGEIGLLGGPDGKSGKTALTPAPDNRWGVFVTGSGEFTSVGDTSNARGYDLTDAGFTLGADYKVTDHFVLGLAMGYDHSDADLVGGGRITVDGGKLALYGTYFTGKGFYTDLAVQGGYNNYETARAAVEGQARGNTDGGELNVLFGTGYDWKIGGLTFGPTANFQYSYIGVNGSDERGSLAPLSLSSQSQDSLRTNFGAKVSYDWKIGGVTVVPEVRVGWQHEYGDNTFQFQSQFEDGGPSFNVQGPSTGRDSLILGAGFAVRWNERVSAYVYYDGELGRTNYESNAVSGGFRVEF